MTFDKFTIKAQETVQEAVNTAQRNGQQTIEPVHLLAGVLNKAKDVTNFLFQKLGVNGQQIEMLTQTELQHLPRVQGGEPYLSSDTNKVLLKAQDYARKQGDEFVSVEPILLALVTDGATAGRILKDAGITEKDLRSAINELRQGQKNSVKASQGQPSRRAEEPEEKPDKQLVTFVRFDREVSDEELAEYQCRRYAQLDDIAIVMLPLKRLPDLAALSCVQRLEANQRAHTTMDTVPKVIDLLNVYQATAQHSAYTGKGVVVGLMDVGFDLTHPNFYQDATLGNSRIKAFWDMLAPSDDDSVLPVGQSYTTQESLQAKTCSTDSPVQAHGSHTLGIAAGSGYDTPYRGVAYESDLCLVSNAVSSDSLYVNKNDYYKFTTATDALGFKYIFDYAEQQQKPCVASFSEGYAPYVDQDDSLYAAFIDKLVGPGRILVASAGNENLSMTYAEKPQGVEVAGAFIKSYGKDAVYRFKTNGPLDIHLPVYDRSTGQLIQTMELSMGDVAVDSVRCDTMYVDDQPLSTRILRYASSVEPTDTIYYLVIHAPIQLDKFAEVGLLMVGKDSHATLHGTSSSALKNREDLDARCVSATYGHNIMAPGCFAASICVGATIHRTGYTNIAGTYVKAGGSATVGQLDYYSSTGPALNGFVKPDITAPGTNIISSFNSYYQEANPTDTGRMVAQSEYGGRTYPWIADSGTSMSTPLVAGTIALWLEARPTLTRDDIIGVLSRTSRQPDETLTYPNNQYGYGEINGYRGLLDILGLTAIQTLSTEQTQAQVMVSEGQLLIRFATTLHSPVTVRLYSLSGKLCGQTVLVPGQQEYKMPLTMTTSGIYAVQLTGGDAGVSGSQIVRL